MKIQGNEMDSLRSYVSREFVDMGGVNPTDDTHSVRYTDPISREKRAFGDGNRVAVKIIDGNITLQDLFDGKTMILPPGSVIYAD